MLFVAIWHPETHTSLVAPTWEYVSFKIQHPLPCVKSVYITALQ